MHAFLGSIKCATLPPPSYKEAAVSASAENFENTLRLYMYLPRCPLAFALCIRFRNAQTNKFGQNWELVDPVVADPVAQDNDKRDNIQIYAVGSITWPPFFEPIKIGVLVIFWCTVFRGGAKLVFLKVVFGQIRGFRKNCAPFLGGV